MTAANANDAHRIWAFTSASIVISVATVVLVTRMVPALAGPSAGDLSLNYVRQDPARTAVHFLDSVYDGAGLEAAKVARGSAEATLRAHSMATASLVPTVAHQLVLQESERVDSTHQVLRGVLSEPNTDGRHGHPISFLMVHTHAGWAVADVYVDDAPENVQALAMRAFAHAGTSDAELP